MSNYPFVGVTPDGRMGVLTFDGRRLIADGSVTIDPFTGLPVLGTGGPGQTIRDPLSVSGLGVSFVLGHASTPGFLAQPLPNGVLMIDALTVAFSGSGAPNLSDIGMESGTGEVQLQFSSNSGASWSTWGRFSSNADAATLAGDGNWTESTAGTTKMISFTFRFPAPLVLLNPTWIGVRVPAFASTDTRAAVVYRTVQTPNT